MLPTVGADTLKIVWYAAEVAGRAIGVAAVPCLVQDAKRRAEIDKSGNLIAATAQQLIGAYVARVLFEFFDSRLAIGKGRGIDKGFDATVSISGEKIRTSLPDRSTSNPDYRAIFPNGTDEFTSPTVKEDEDLAIELRQSVNDSTLAVKAEVLGLLDAIIPIVGPAATAVRDGEKQVGTLFQTEMAGRKLVADTLWEERKNIENALGRGGRTLARFIFFDYSKKAAGSGDTTEDPAAGGGPAASTPPVGP